MSIPTHQVMCARCGKVYTIATGYPANAPHADGCASDSWVPVRQGDDPDRWRSRKTAGDLSMGLGEQAVRQFRRMVLVHRWEMWKRAEADNE